MNTRIVHQSTADNGTIRWRVRELLIASGETAFFSGNHNGVRLIALEGQQIKIDDIAGRRGISSAALNCGRSEIEIINGCDYRVIVPRHVGDAVLLEIMHVPRGDHGLESAPEYWWESRGAGAESNRTNNIRMMLPFYCVNSVLASGKSIGDVYDAVSGRAT